MADGWHLERSHNLSQVTEATNDIAGTGAQVGLALASLFTHV